MAIQWNKSLYSKLNKETSAENQRICNIVEEKYPEIYSEFCCVTTTGGRKRLLEDLDSGKRSPDEFI